MLDKNKAREAVALLRQQVGKTFDFVNLSGTVSVYEKDAKVLGAADGKVSHILHLHTRGNAFNPGHILFHEATLLRCNVIDKEGEGGTPYSILELEMVPVSSMSEWLLAGGYDWLKETEKDSENLSKDLPLSGLCGE
jgi:hypothetical protein